MTVWVDNSILEATATCHTQVLMRYVFGYCLKEGLKIPNTGKAIHKAHETWFTTWQVEPAIAALEAAYDEWVGPYAADMEPGDDCQKQNVVDIVRQYYTNHPKESFPFEPIVEGIEQVHHAPLVDDIEFFGLIDMPVRAKVVGSLHVCDHKNRFGYINEWWTKKFSLTSQFTGYVWLLQTLYNETVPGVYINAIQVKKLPDPTSTRCKTHKVPMSECRLEHATSQLFISQRTPVAIEKWHGEAVRLAREFKWLKENYVGVEMVQHARDQGRFNGGCTFCDFRKWCRADRVPKLADGMFVIDHWKPWEGC